MSEPRQLGVLDTVLLGMEQPRAPFHIMALLMCDPVDRDPYDAVLDHMQRRLHLAPLFRRRLVRVPLSLDRPYWADAEDFELTDHVHHVELEAPGDWDRFRVAVADRHATPLDLELPPWELHVITGLQDVDDVEAGGFAMLLKVHHSAIDGIGGADMLTVILDQEASPAQAEAPPPWEPEGGPGAIELLTSAAVGAADPRKSLRIAGHVARAVPGTLPKIVAAAAKAAPDLPQLIGTTSPPPDAAPKQKTRFNGPITERRVFGAVGLPLDDVKAVKNAAGTTINDVVLTWVAGGMRRYLESHGEPPEGPLRTAVPVNTRTDEDEKDGNVAALTVGSLRVDIEDGMERLKATRKGNSHLKSSGASAADMLKVAQLLPGALIGLAVRAIPLAPASMLPFDVGVSNVPGPPKPLYFNGAKVRQMYGGFPLLDNMGLAHMVGSYDHHLACSFLACAEMMPDPDHYENCLRGSFDELLAGTRRGSR
jgi:WS/DGAT/MGAT family acyltransferase